MTLQRRFDVIMNIIASCVRWYSRPWSVALVTTLQYSKLCFILLPDNGTLYWTLLLTLLSPCNIHIPKKNMHLFVCWWVYDHTTKKYISMFTYYFHQYNIRNPELFLADIHWTYSHHILARWHWYKFCSIFLENNFYLPCHCIPVGTWRNDTTPKRRCDDVLT